MVSGVTWGPWSAWQSEDIPTGGLSVAVICGLIASYAPWLTIPAIAAIVAGKYDTITLKFRMRWGEKGNYEYYERQTKIYADGKQVGGVYTDTGVSGGNGVKTVLPSLQ